MPRNPGGTVSGFKLLSTPDAPTITGVTTSIGSASVAFTAPTDTGDGAITSYVVTAVDESSGVSTGGTGTSSPITVSPPAGGTFKIRMQALNPYGPGRLTEYDTGNVIYGGAQLYAWGDNSPNGQLGDDTVINRSSPVQVGALTNWAQVSSGFNFSGSVKSDGTLWMWGANNVGQLGDGSVTPRSSPVQVGALTNWSYISSGDNSSSAIKTDGTLWGWGFNSHGEVGDGSATPRSSPVQVGALTNWAQVSRASGSSFATAVTADGKLYAWGRNNNGQLGQNDLVSRSSPVQVGALTNWAQVSVGGDNSSGAIKTDGTLWMWGDNSPNGTLGDNTVVDRSSPVQIGSLTNWQLINLGRSHSSAIKTDGTIWAWGSGASGELGGNNIVSRSSPVQIGALTNWRQVKGGNGFTSSLRSDGTLWSWGGNFDGQLSQNDRVSRSSPVQIGALTNWYEVSVGDAHTLALYGVV